MLEFHSKWRNLLQRLNGPLQAADHAFPHLIKRPQLLARLDQRKEHAELRAPELLEQATEDVVVVEEVLAALCLEVCEGLL